MKRKLKANFPFLLFAFLTLGMAQEIGAQALAPREVYRRAMELFKDNDYQGAIPLLEQSVNNYELLKDHALYYLAEALSQNGQKEEALKRFSLVPQAFPESVWVERSLLKQGDVLVELGKVGEGREAYSRLLAAYPQSNLVPEASLKLALAYMRKDNYKLAREGLVNLWLDYPLSAQAAEAKRLIGQMEAAKKVAKKEPPAERWFRRASILFEAGRFNVAIAELKALGGSFQLKAKAALTREVSLKLGQALLRARQWAGAKDVFSRIIQNYPQTEEGQASLYWLGRVALRQDRAEEAKLLFEQLIIKFPQSDFAVQALLSLGRMAEEAGDTAKASVLYQRLMTEYSDRPEVLAAKWRLSFLDYVTGEFRRAAQRFKELADAAADSYRYERATFWQGKALEKMGGLEQAGKLYLELVEQAPLSYHGFRALEHLKALDPEKAKLELAGKGSRLQGNLPPANDENLHLKKARELVSIDLKGDARRELNRVLVRAVNERGLILPVSQLYMAMGDYSQSHLVMRRHFSEALKQAPSSGQEALYWQLAYPRAFEPLVLKYAQRNNLASSLVYAVIREESAFDPLALSRSGAMGLMQIIPSTGSRVAASQGLRPFDPKGLYDPEVSIWFGTWYLNSRLEQYAFEKTLALAAYNAGAGVVNKWLAQNGYVDPDLFVEQIPYEETRAYVQRVLKSYFAYQTIYAGSQP